MCVVEASCCFQDHARKNYNVGCVILTPNLTVSEKSQKSRTHQFPLGDKKVSAQVIGIGTLPIEDEKDLDFPTKSHCE